jgi:hypothetical protein
MPVFGASTPARRGQLSLPTRARTTAHPSRIVGQSCADPDISYFAPDQGGEQRRRAIMPLATGVSPPPGGSHERQFDLDFVSFGHRNAIVGIARSAGDSVSDTAYHARSSNVRSKSVALGPRHSALRTNRTRNYVEVRRVRAPHLVGVRTTWSFVDALSTRHRCPRSTPKRTSAIQGVITAPPGQRFFICRWCAATRARVRAQRRARGTQRRSSAFVSNAP